MDDLIRRADAIEATWQEPTYTDPLNVLTEVRDRIESIPSADRPQGEWIKHDEERDYCSVCKHIFTTRAITKQDKWTTYVDDLGYNFCPNCGARMKGADNEVLRQL